jgi:hypothetical protein
VPLNLLSLYVSVVGRNLIAKNPRVMLSTFERKQKATVAAMMDWCNREIERMRLAETLQRIVLDGLFSIGIAKVALASPSDSAAFAWNLRAGEPFIKRVDLDDFVYDVHSRAFEEWGYVGHRYRVPLAVVKEDKHFSRGRKDLTASNDQLYNAEGDERISVLGRGVYASYTEEYEDYVDLWEIYLPRHRLVVTLADSDLGGPAEVMHNGSQPEPLRVQGWLGPDSGPYKTLGYGVVPGNAMPKGPIQDLMDNHEACNNIMRKLVAASMRIKELLLVAGGAMEDGSRVQTANDGEILRVDNPERMAQVVMGGNAVQQLEQVTTFLRDLFSWQAGNLDIMGGLSPQSKTAHQDAMLNENSSRQMADMQDRTVTFTSDVIKSWLWYEWNHPHKVHTGEYSPQGSPDVAVKREIHPAGARAPLRREGRFEDLGIRVDPYSLQHNTPQTRLASMMQLLTQLYLPMAPIAQQQGVGLDLNACFKKFGEYMDQPDLDEILTVQEPPQDPGGGATEQPGMPQNTTRNYVRENRPGRTRQGNDLNMMSALAGVNPGGAPKNGKPQGLAQ